MNAVFLVMLNALHAAQPVIEAVLERLMEDPARSDADLRHLEAACSVFKQDANALVAMLIGRHSEEDMVAEVEVLFRYFGQGEAQIGLPPEKWSFLK